MSIKHDVATAHDRNSRPHSFRKKLFIVIFGTDTPGGKLFDVVLLALIFLSVLAVMLETVGFISTQYKEELRILEWVLTAFFSLEYAARIWAVDKPKKYIFSFLGIIDFLALLPSYLSFFIVGTQGLLIIRALRLLRVFRVLKLMRFVSESEVLGKALLKARHKIIVFFFFLIILVFILGSVMYLLEGPENGFKSIPLSIYWAIVTLTTVGFGDITPQTFPGQLVASLVMLLGYAIIAIPTGIVGAEIYKETSTNGQTSREICTKCTPEDHEPKTTLCNRCGSKINLVVQKHETSILRR